MKIGLGITTYNRPDYLARCLKGVEKHLLGSVDVCYLYNDGSTKGAKAYKQVYKALPSKIEYKHSATNKGVAVAKNWLLKKMMDEGCDYMFLLEDDIVPQSAKAITEYIRLSELSGIEHFLFAHHGTANEGKLYLSENGVELYTACIGAYCMYTRKVVEQVGYFDENFVNAFEHVEHTYRIARAGLSTPYPTYPDIQGSNDYLREIEGSIDKSSIRVRKDWMSNILNALLYWDSKDRNFPFRDKLEGLMREVETA